MAKDARMQSAPDPRVITNWKKACGDFHLGPERKTQVAEIFDKNRNQETSTPAPWCYFDLA